MECDHTTTWDCIPHGHSSPNHAIEVVRIMTIYHHATIRGVTIPSRGVACRMAIHRRATVDGWRAARCSMTIPSRGIAPQMAGAHARKGAREVTPKGLYFREGRVDERSEIYPVWMSPHAKSYPLGGCTFFNSPRHFTIDARFCECVNHDDAMP